MSSGDGFTLNTWCANTNIPEVRRLAATIEALWPQTLLFPQTRLTNARTEGINRIVKDAGRRARGFRTRPFAVERGVAA